MFSFQVDIKVALKCNQKGIKNCNNENFGRKLMHGSTIFFFRKLMDRVNLHSSLGVTALSPLRFSPKRFVRFKMIWFAPWACISTPKKRNLVPGASLPFKVASPF